MIILKYLQKRRKMGWCIYCNISKVQSDSRLHKKPTDPTPTSFSPAPPAWPPPTATFSPESLQLPRGYVLLGELCFAWKAVFCFWQLCFTLQSVHLEGCVFLRELCFTLQLVFYSKDCISLRKLCFSLQGVFHSEDCVLLECWELSQALPPSSYSCLPLSLIFIAAIQEENSGGDYQHQKNISLLCPL